jgi:hypothetical protein
MELFGIEEHKYWIILHNIVYSYTKKHSLASNTDPKIAEDKQHFRTKKNPHIYLWKKIKIF